MDSMQNTIFGDKMNILNEMGISTAEDYNKRGQISLDESKFTEALVKMIHKKVYKAFCSGSNSMMEKMKSTVKIMLEGLHVFAQKLDLKKLHL